MQHTLVIEFWFNKVDRKKWWTKDTEFDQLIATRFKELHLSATNGELYHWRETPEGRLAEIILLDQFSRNIYRDTPLAFASDSQALVLAQEAIRVGANQQLTPEKQAFLYIPFMHSESSDIHKIAVKLFSEPGLEANLNFELRHKKIIDRFGRYPHRNRILGRKSTQEEIDFLKQPGSSF